MANNLTSSGLYIGNGTLARVARIGSDSEMVITKVNYSQSVSGSGTAHAASTISLPLISVGTASVEVYNNSSTPGKDSPTNLYINLPASGRYLYATKSASSKGPYSDPWDSLILPSAASVSGTLSLSSNVLNLTSSIGTSAGVRVSTISNSAEQSPSGGIIRYVVTRQTGAILYGRIS